MRSASSGWPTTMAMVPGRPLNSLSSPNTSTRSSALNRSTWSLPSEWTAIESTSGKSTMAARIEPLSRDHLNVAVPNGPGSWISTR